MATTTINNSITIETEGFDEKTEREIIKCVKKYFDESKLDFHDVAINVASDFSSDVQGLNHAKKIKFVARRKDYTC